VQLGIICGKSSYDLFPAKASSPDFLYPLVRGHSSREGDPPTTRGPTQICQQQRLLRARSGSLGNEVITELHLNIIFDN
jgi:hypothetical protein